MNPKRMKTGDRLAPKGKLHNFHVRRFYDLVYIRKVPVLQINENRPGLNESLEIMKIFNGIGLKYLYNIYVCNFIDYAMLYAAHAWWSQCKKIEPTTEKSNYKLAALENFDETIKLSKNFDSKITNAWYGFIFNAVEKEVLTDGWLEFISLLDFSKGDYFGGKTDLGYVDITVLPWMNRMDCLYAHKRYCLSKELDSESFDKKGFQIDSSAFIGWRISIRNASSKLNSLKTHYQYRKWSKTVLEHPSVSKTIQNSFENVNVSIKW